MPNVWFKKKISRTNEYSPEILKKNCSHSEIFLNQENLSGERKDEEQKEERNLMNNDYLLKLFLNSLITKKF